MSQPVNPPRNGLVLHGPIQLATGRIRCWKCKKDTGVVAIIIAGTEEFEDGVSLGLSEEGESYLYGLDEDEMPGQLVALLAVHAPNYRPIYSGTMQETSWANGCEHCGALQGTFYQHMEPDSPFFGDPGDFAGTRLQLLGENLVMDYDEGASAGD